MKKLLTILIMLVPLVLVRGQQPAAHPDSRLYITESNGKTYKVDRLQLKESEWGNRNVHDADATSTDVRPKPLQNRETYLAEGLTVYTETDAQLTYVLSNQTGIRMEPSSRMYFKKFIQEPFRPNRTELDYEPSLSQTDAYIPHGWVGMCTPYLVAGSRMTVHTPQVDIEIRGAKVAIEATDVLCKVSLLDGTVFVRRRQMDYVSRELHIGQQAIITEAGVEVIDIPREQNEKLEDIIACACWARKAVMFDERKGKIGAYPIIPTDLPVEYTISPARIETPRKKSFTK